MLRTGHSFLSLARFCPTKSSMLEILKASNFDAPFSDFSLESKFRVGFENHISPAWFVQGGCVFYCINLVSPPWGGQ